MQYEFNREAFARSRYIETLPVSVAWDELKTVVSVLIVKPAPGDSPFHLHMPGQNNHPVFDTLREPKGAFRPENGVLVHNPVLWLASENGKHLVLEWDKNHQTGLCRILSYTSEFKDVMKCDFVDAIEDYAACETAVGYILDWAREACPEDRRDIFNERLFAELRYQASPFRERPSGPYPFPDLPPAQGMEHKFHSSVTLEEAYLSTRPLGHDLPLLTGFIDTMTTMPVSETRPFTLKIPAQDEAANIIEIKSATGCTLFLKPTPNGDVRLQAKYSNGAESIEFHTPTSDPHAQLKMLESLMQWASVEWAGTDIMEREIFLEMCAYPIEKDLEKALAAAVAPPKPLPPH